MTVASRPKPIPCTFTAQDWVLHERYGYVRKAVHLETRCGCHRTIDLDLEFQELPPLIGVPLTTRPSTFLWIPPSDKTIEDVVERIFVFKVQDNSGIHYEESGTEQPRPRASGIASTGARMITFEDDGYGA